MAEVAKKHKISLGTNFWADLPQDLLISIINRLHYSDQVLFRAVCKNWRVPENFIRCYDPLPWVTEQHPRLYQSSPNAYSFTYELFDPHSQNSHKISNSIPTSNNISPDLPYGDTEFLYLYLYASKQGWSLLGRDQLIFLHNPFTNDIISLPDLDFNFKYVEAATLTTNPTSPECKVIVFCKALSDSKTSGSALVISRYCLSGDNGKHWSTEVLETPSSKLFGIQYLKGSIYCLFEYRTLKRYSLANKTWTSLTIGSPPEGHHPHDIFPYSSFCKCWLIRKGEDLMMACPDFGCFIEDWRIYKFDFSAMSWVYVENSRLAGCAFFINEDIAFATHLADTAGEKIEDCKLFFLDELKCFRLTERLSTEYSQVKRGLLDVELCYIEPPYVRN